MKLALLTFLFNILFICNAYCQSVSDYRLLIRKGKESHTLKIHCSFIIDYANADSISFCFGGNFNDFAVSDMKISCRSDYRFLPEERKLVFYKSFSTFDKVNLRYGFLNLTSAVIYGNADAEIWEVIFENRGEYYYPLLPFSEYSMEICVKTPKRIMVIPEALLHSRYEVLKTPVNLCFCNSRKYFRTEFCGEIPIAIYQIKGEEADNSRINELVCMSRSAIEYFEKIYGDSYLNENFGVTEYPTYVFHDGNASFNRYNMNIISASQNKFATYDDIYPLAHEIGHRWIGEYTIDYALRSAGCPFAMESLNEFMTMMFIKDVYGHNEYNQKILQYKKLYEKQCCNGLDVKITNICKNNDIIAIYRKGPLILHYIGNIYGFDTVKESISLFYNSCKTKSEVCLNDYITCLAAINSKAALELMTLIDEVNIEKLYE